MILEWFGLERYGMFFATRGLIRPGPTYSLKADSERLQTSMHA